MAIATAISAANETLLNISPPWNLWGHGPAGGRSYPASIKPSLVKGGRVAAYHDGSQGGTAIRQATSPDDYATTNRRGPRRPNDQPVTAFPRPTGTKTEGRRPGCPKALSHASHPARPAIELNGRPSRHLYANTHGQSSADERLPAESPRRPNGGPETLARRAPIRPVCGLPLSTSGEQPEIGAARSLSLIKQAEPPQAGDRLQIVGYAVGGAQPAGLPGA